MGKLDGRKLARSAAPWVGLLALLAATAVAYGPSLRGGFVLDDDRVVVWNPDLRQPDAVRLPRLRELLGTARPLTSVSFAADLRGGLDPGSFHRTGLLLHLLTVVTAFVLLRRLLVRVGHARPAGVALVVASLFALHPIQLESVAYVSQRSEVLSTLLYLWTLLLLDAVASHPRGARGAVTWTGGVFAWVLAMGAKAIAISLPAAFLADQLVLAPAGERGGRAAARRAVRGAVIVLPIAALAAWSATMQLATLEAAPGGGAGFRATPLTSVQYLLTQLRVQWLYLRLLAWPAGLSIDRPFEASRALDPAALLAAAGLVLAVGLALWTWARAERSPADAPAHRLVAFGILFWLVVLSPTSSLVPVLDLAVEHRVYLASLGPFLAFVAAADALLFGRLAPRTTRIVAAALTLAALVPLGVALRVRADAWSSPAGIWREAEVLAPTSPRIVVNLGAALAHAGDVPGAEAAFQRAWPLVRDPEAVVTLAQNHGGLLLLHDRPAEALAVLDRAVPLDPLVAGFWSNRATALGYLGRNAEALADARRAAALEPRTALYRNMLGVALLIAGDADGAQGEFAAAEALDPGNPTYPVTAAVALELAGRRTEACATYRRARATTRQLPLPAGAATRAARLGCPIE